VGFRGFGRDGSYSQKNLLKKEIPLSRKASNKEISISYYIYIYLYRGGGVLGVFGV
jgi:hypothetical protein